MSPPDPASLLASGAAALGCPLESGRLARLMKYLDLLRRWGRVYNLTALTSAQAIVTHHLLDSLAVVPSLRRQQGGRPFRLLDVGSGAGLPGLVIATALDEVEVTCVDKVAKKVAFIRQASVELGLDRVRAIHGRAESLPHGRYDVAVSRAFASLSDFVSVSRTCLSGGGVWLAMKGRPPEETLEGDEEVFHVEQVRVPFLDAERCFVWIRRRDASR